ncbi:hypothetical protein B0H12DRAFT_1132694 [Mycena haematopus]|nr:hypothetical protein B0H12DRAFT_1132694 [Mycena haematopus]
MHLSLIRHRLETLLEPPCWQLGSLGRPRLLFGQSSLHCSPPKFHSRLNHGVDMILAQSIPVCAVFTSTGLLQASPNTRAVIRLRTAGGVRRGCDRFFRHSSFMIRTI